MSNKVITISREFGSGGRTVGKMVAEKLGIPCYDQEIIQKIVEESGYCEDFVAEHSEHAAYGNWLSNAFAFRDYYGNSIQDKIWFAQLKTIVELANKGPCVIVGRSADYILRKYDTLDVFIYAPLEDKIQRTVRFKNVSEREAKKLVKDTDKKRSINYKYYTGKSWGERENYTLMLNSTVLGIEKTADFIAEIYRKETEE